MEGAIIVVAERGRKELRSGTEPGGLRRGD